MNFIKKHKKLSIFVGLLLFFIFYEVIPEIKGDKGYLLTRLFFSHPELAKTTKVRSYILTDEQVGELFLHPNREPVLLNNKELMTLTPRRLNLVFRFPSSAIMYGVIKYHINNDFRGKLNVLDLSMHDGKKSDFQNYVIPLGDIVLKDNDNPIGYPKITYKWKEIYACW